MLAETFIASIGVLNNAHRTDAGKDVAIAVLEHQPVVQIKSSYKKSITPAHCLAASPTHIFAAQQAKAVVHVYNRVKGSQEATVPFPERVTSIALACADTVLIVATCEGKIFLWETTSGRQVHVSQSHLQDVTALVVDSASNFFISASADSTAQVWSLPKLLSFETDVDARTPALAFTSHRSRISDIALGHSATHQNFAASVSDDKTCLLWNYHDGAILATFLLSYTPVAIQLDAADRAIYVGYDDGSLQQIDLYDVATSRSKSVQNGSQITFQPGDKRRWTQADDTNGSLLCLAMSFDSTLVLTGHQSGAVSAWDVATGHMRLLALQPPMPGPVTNLLLCPMGIASDCNIGVQMVVKPKFAAMVSDTSSIPLSYAMHLQLGSTVHATESAFQRALRAPSVPQEMLDDGLAELLRWSQVPQANGQDKESVPAEDFMALDSRQDDAQATLTRENAELKRQLSSLRHVQMATFDRMDRLSAEKKALIQRENDRMLKRQHEEELT